MIWDDLNSGLFSLADARTSETALWYLTAWLWLVWSTTNRWLFVLKEGHTDQGYRGGLDSGFMATLLHVKTK